MKNKLLITIAILLSTSCFALKPEKKYMVIPEKYSLIYKELNATTSDGFKIKVWFLPAQKFNVDGFNESYNSKEKPKKRTYSLLDTIPKPTIIICDGDAGNMGYNLHLVLKYVFEGYNVALFDWRGFGESDDFEMNQDYLFYSEFLLDYQAVINLVNEQAETRKDHIGLFGFSTGAYFSFAAAYQNPKIKCFIGRGLMTSFDEFMPYLYAIRPKKEREMFLPDNYPKKLCAINIVDDFDKPAFLIVGRHDNRTPVVMSETIYKRLHGEKELWIVNGAGHGGAEAPEVKESKLFTVKTTSFFDKYLK